ncbi:MAG: S41 family peptidase [Rhodobacter sp.]|uniref:S41 family peptidase n=1 Tax=Pararhodobacter sp. TaxID=2127056 RepID=UPI001D5B2F48|nr:S41 family peptidase [Pararhodobacter sp.]MCB1346759.1 S41 family peptidase [Paracoccaceae bacterium]MCC0072118.1 S41 family peptidase [Rhodobacter sp.]HPD91611.1 S41 family peptidase [Pararhodobacter sp.]
MNKYLVAALAGIVGGVVLSTQVAGPLLAQEQDANQSVYDQLDLFGDVLERIRSEYVTEVDTGQLIEAAINGMLNSLDPHSSYLSPDDYDDMRVQTRGSFGGLGIEVTQQDGYIRVITPIDDTPAAQAGVQPGDVITHVDGQSVLGLTMAEAIDQMRGPVGSEVVVTIMREGVAEPFDLSIIRDTIRIQAVRSRVEGNIIVLRVTTFNEQTYDNLASELAQGIEQLGGIDGLQGVVLDLRNNPGGLLNQAIDVSDAFLEQGEIVSTRGRANTEGERHNATPGDLIEGRPMVVLINGGSASASEIVAGALQDHHRAVVVGERSFGKGSVQTLIPLRGDGAMRLTTALYYTPSGRSIQALGVAPDIVVHQLPRADETTPAEDARPQRTEAGLRGAFRNETITDDERRQMEEEERAAEEVSRLRGEDYQLAYALDILRGLSVMNGH